MKIFGHKLIESEEFHRVDTIIEIKNTPPNSTILLSKLDIEVAKFCQKNGINYAVEIDNIKDAIFANILDCKYAITNMDLAKRLMPIAQNYLFDMLILAKIRYDNQIEEMAIAGVDGVVFINKIV